MAMNPMQRKANNYLLIGVLVTLLITGSIIALLIMQLNKLDNQIKKEANNKQSVYVLSADIKSGETIDSSYLKQVTVTKDAIPSDAITLSEITEDTVAKINLQSGTIITSNMIVSSDEEISSDLRVQEYNMILLPSQIKQEDYIDIRLRMPNGTDYIVVSKKKVDIPTIDGVESENTIRIQMTEEEILTMSNAIVEAYWATGSVLYATTYVEPGTQGEATPTYLPSDKVIELMTVDPNIATVAKNELFTRYNNTSGSVRTNIVNILNSYEDGNSSVQSGVQEEITNAQEQRQKYLESLGGY
jgi:hypothetical protein